MPCGYEMPGDRDIARLQDELNRRTRFLCHLLKGKEPTKEIQKWWKEHNAKDIEKQVKLINAQRPLLDAEQNKMNKLTRELAEMEGAR